jgi:nitroreductase
MSFLELAQKRYSVRSYTGQSVADEDLQKILEAGRLAPSAANFQPWHFIVVRDPGVKARLGEAYKKDWFLQAPVVIVVCVSPNHAWTRQDGRNYAFVDAAIAMDHMTLCAADLGLGTCWIAAFDPAKVRNALGLPGYVEPVAMTPVGRPAFPATPKKRKALSAVVHWERWQDKI